MDNVNKFENEIMSFPKPNNKGLGSTIQFAVSQDKSAVFMTIARQKSDTTVENARFDYEKKEIIKLSPKDMGEIIAVIDGKADSINGDKGIYHEYKESKSSIKLKKNDPKYGGFFIDVSKNGVAAKMPITYSEAIQIKVMFEEAIRLYYKWGK